METGLLTCSLVTSMADAGLSCFDPWSLLQVAAILLNHYQHYHPLPMAFGNVHFSTVVWAESWTFDLGLDLSPQNSQSACPFLWDPHHFWPTLILLFPWDSCLFLLPCSCNIKSLILLLDPVLSHKPLCKICQVSFETDHSWLYDYYFFQMWAWNVGISSPVEAVIVCLEPLSWMKDTFPELLRVVLSEESRLAHGHNPPWGNTLWLFDVVTAIREKRD